MNKYLHKGELRTTKRILEELLDHQKDWLVKQENDA